MVTEHVICKTKVGDSFMKSGREVLKITGYAILAVSCILFILIPVVPWMGFSVKASAGIAAGLLIAGEILFYLSLAILGRSFLGRIKGWLRFWKVKSGDPDVSSDSK